MKTTISMLLAFVFGAFFAQAQNKETRSVETFNNISFRMSGKCYLRQGSPQKVEIEASKESLAKISSEVSNGTLVISTAKKWSNWNWRDEDRIKVYITVSDIKGIDISGSGDLLAQTVLTGTDFRIGISGSGSFEAELNASGNVDVDISGSGSADMKGKFQSLDSDISGSGGIDLVAAISGTAKFGVSGSGKVTASGSAQSVKISISGSGDVNAADMAADACNVNIAGSGDARVNVKSSLDANIGGSGSVSYKGDPSHVNSHSAGSGSIRKL